MRKPIKRAASFLLLCSMVYLSFIGYGMHALTETISVEEQSLARQQTVALGTPYTAEVAAASGTAEAADYKLLRVFPVKSARITAAKRSYVVAGGEVFGIKLYTRGVLVARTDVVTTENGNENPAQAAGLRGGDVITHIDGKEVNRKREVSAAIENSGGTPLLLTVERGAAELALEVRPVKSAAGDKYVAGLWIRDSSAGIGTVTFLDPESRVMAGLGHPICDVDSGEIIPISGGEMVAARVMGCYKGTDGMPGELCGLFEAQSLASLEQNGEAGVYGRMADRPAGDLMPVALKSEVKTGPAQIAATVSGTEKKYYDVEIIKVSPGTNSTQKNMIIRVTDPALIEATGGIVQGMSGSPLIQNGMLAGAVTHVFVNSPLEGYAIYAETMLETARKSS